MKKFILNLLFPRVCLNCQREENYLCDDCLSLIEITDYQYCLCEKPKRIIEREKCPRCRFHKLDFLYFAASYQNNLVKNLIQKFKYEPFIKELAQPLAFLIAKHFQLFNNPPIFYDYCLMPIPLEKRKLKRRGFNQAQELAEELSKHLGIPVSNDVLIKKKGTLSQTELSGKEREENIKGAFSCQNKEKIQGRKILLIDDVYTTGSTMEEAARVLKLAGAKEVCGAVIARG